MAVNRQRAVEATRRGATSGAAAFLVWALGSALIDGGSLTRVVLPALAFGVAFGAAFGVMQYRRS